MFRVAALVALVATLAACNVADIRELFSNAKAVASDLEQSTGMKPEVGFNWQNGRLEGLDSPHPRSTLVHHLQLPVLLRGTLPVTDAQGSAIKRTEV